MKIDNFYGNARVIRMKNHYAHRNEKLQFHFGYYHTLHDNITKRFFWKKRLITRKNFCMGKNGPYAKNLDYATISKIWAPMQKWKCVIKSFFCFFKNFFLHGWKKNLVLKKSKSMMIFENHGRIEKIKEKLNKKYGGIF